MMIPWWVQHLLSPLSFLLTLVFVSSILRTRRPAGSIMAWLIVILVAPYIGIPLYLFLGGRKFRLKSKMNIYVPQANPSANESWSRAQKILNFSGVPDARSNQVIQLLPTGVDAYKKLIKLIQGAEKSIYITTFIFGNDPVGKAIVAALSEKAKAGVEIRLLVDSLGAAWVRLPSFKDFKASGGKIAYFMPLLHIPLRGRTNLRNHRKLMVVDSKHALVGGMNLAQEYLGPEKDPTRWVDLGVYVEGDSVADIEDIFFKDWAYATHEKPQAPSMLDPRSRAVDKFQAQVVASGPDVAHDPLYDVLLSSINDAEKNIWIVTPYFIPDEPLTKALELAVKRGVKVQVIIPLHSNHQLADLARGSFVRQLDAVGVRFAFYPKMIHAKVVLVDQTLAVLGSANFDMRSLLLNYELGLIIYSEEVLKKIEQWILEKSQGTTHGLTPAGYIKETVEGIGRVMAPVL